MFNCRNYTLGVFVPKAKQRDTKHTIGIISIWYFNNKHFLFAQSKSEAFLPLNIVHFYLAICSKRIKWSFDTFIRLAG